MNFTKMILKRPVSIIMAVLCLIVFGLTSVTSMKQELTPEMEMPMLIVLTTYNGAGPEDVDELLSKPIEDTVSTLNGVKSVASTSSDGYSMVMLEYEYGTDIDKAYNDLKKKMDGLAARGLPEDSGDPSIMEISINDSAVMSLVVDNDTAGNLYNYVNNSVVPEIEKLPSVAEVSVQGGQKEYIRIELSREKLQQYKLDMNAVMNAVAAADLSYPGGTVSSGNLELSVTTSASYDTAERLKKIPISLKDGSILYLKDVADISSATEAASSIARYNGSNTVALSIKKQQSSTAQDCSTDVTQAIGQMTAADPELSITVTDDSSQDISDSLRSVAETMVLAIFISMVIIFLFFGDWKASLIVGTSIPVSILAALILMSAMGFSLNIISMAAIVMGVGMMVDNSIVVLESCFRMTPADTRENMDYAAGAIEGTQSVRSSIIGSTLTTCVVFLPLALITGMSGQMFKPLGFTITFCMMASLLSAITIVPLCYKFYRPVVNMGAPMYRPIQKLQDWYRKTMRVLLPKKKTIIATSVALLLCSLLVASQLGVELIPADDTGTVSISVEMQPGLKLEKADEILRQIETVIGEDDNLDSYLVSYGGSGMSASGSTATITAYLKEDRTLETADISSIWEFQLSELSNCTITAEASTSMSMMSSTDSYQLILKGTQYSQLKESSDEIVKQLYQYEGLTNVHSSLENAASVIDIQVDSVMAAAEGLSAVQIGSSINQMVSGAEATTLDVDGEELSVRVEYPEGSCDTLEKLRSATLSTPSGGSVALGEVAQIHFKDSPSSITRSDKEYQVTISGRYTVSAKEAAELERQIQTKTVEPALSEGVTMGTNDIDQSMMEEFTSLGMAILTAVFLLFSVMAVQFESPRFSIMVMTTIPFSLIGAFGLMALTDTKISMTALLGFLMLIGTVVNNGILYVDTVNQLRRDVSLTTALVEAGAIRLRPILLTTLTTVISMVPMILATDGSASMTRGIAVVNVGGLIAGTVLALLMLPAYYAVVCKKDKQLPE